jgi:hypothetical protein
MKMNCENGYLPIGLGIHVLCCVAFVETVAERMGAFGTARTGRSKKGGREAVERVDGNHASRIHPPASAGTSFFGKQLVSDSVGCAKAGTSLCISSQDAWLSGIQITGIPVLVWHPIPMTRPGPLRSAFLFIPCIVASIVFPDATILRTYPLSDACLEMCGLRCLRSVQDQR